MIINRDQPEVAEKIRRESDANAVVGALVKAADAAPDAFEIDPGATGFDLRACAPLPSGLANRARLKVVAVRPGRTLIFFYKKSLVPHSRDRYSYGGIDLRTPEVEASEIAEWLRFASSGFHPDRRPAGLRRAIPFEIPD
jgi:hypothetical protein